MKHAKKSLLAAGLLVVALPAAAQKQEGLVNVNVSDVDTGIIANVQVPVAIAANVCGVDVNVLSKQLPGNAECNAEADSVADNEQFMRLAETQGKAKAIRDASS